MSRVFQLNGTHPRDPRVEAWLRDRTDTLGAIARRWFERLRQCGSEVRETLHDGCPTACLGDAAFAYVGVFKKHVNVGFFHGADLPDPKALLEGTGRFMRHVKIRPDRPMDDPALEALVAHAYRDIKSRRQNPTP